MKKKTVYLFKIQPKGYNNAIELSFNFLPKAEEVVEVINEMAGNTDRNDFISLCKTCVSGIQTWGLPKVIDVNGSYLQWKNKGDTMYSSKGYVAIKQIACYSKG